MAAHLWYQGPDELENKQNKEQDELFVFGYACKVFRDDEKALYIDRGAHLIPWMGDDRLQIDRYDGRGHLFDLSQYDASNFKDTDHQISLSEDERQMEKLCDEERYLELRTDIAEQNMYEEEEWKRYYESLSEGYNAVGFMYDYGHGSEEQQVQAPVEEKPFEVPQELRVTEDMEVPDTEKLNSIIEKTAKFISEHGAQMEIIIKTKQANNPQFLFLHFDNPLNPYYKHMVKMIKSGKYKPKEQTNSDHDSSYEDDQDNSSGYLHPSLTANRASPTPDLAPIKMPTVSVHDTPYGQLIKSLKKNYKPQEKSSDTQEKKPPREPVIQSAPQPPPPPYISQPEYGPAHPGVPPPPGLEPVTLPSAQPVLLNHDMEMYSERQTESPTSEDSSSRDSPLPSLPGQPKIVPPPPDIQPVIDRMAMYVAKNGEEFEIVVKSKNDPRFEFLETYHMHFPYYNFKKQIHVTETAKEKKRLENEKPKGVSFSIKGKPKEHESTSRVEKRQVFDDGSSDEDGRDSVYRSDVSGTTTPVEPREWCLGLDDRPHRNEVSQDVLEKKMAEERLKDKMAAAAREKLVQASKEKQMQAERKRKAAMFINMLKSTSQGASGDDTNQEDTGASSSTPLGSRSHTPIIVEDDVPDRSSKSSRRSRRSPSPRSRRSPSPRARRQRHRHRRSPTPPSAYNQIKRSASKSPLRRLPGRSSSPFRRRDRSRSPHGKSKSRSPYRKSRSRSPKHKTYKRTRSPSPLGSRKKIDKERSPSSKKSKKKKKSRSKSPSSKKSSSSRSSSSQDLKLSEHHFPSENAISQVAGGDNLSTARITESTSLIDVPVPTASSHDLTLSDSNNEVDGKPEKSVSNYMLNRVRAMLKATRQAVIEEEGGYDDP